MTTFYATIVLLLDDHVPLLLAAGTASAAIPAGRSPSSARGSGNAGLGSVAAGPDGNLWFTRDDPGSRRVHHAGGCRYSSSTAGITPGSQPIGIAAGPDGNLWFTEPGSDSHRAHHAGGCRDRVLGGITPNAGLREIALGPDGNMWFTETDVDQIGRITPAGVVTEFAAGFPSVRNRLVLQLVLTAISGSRSKA